MKLKIKVTKDILEKSKDCYTNSIQNCAIALACRDVFPTCNVTACYIRPFPCTKMSDIEIGLPNKAFEYVVRFDSSSPEERVLMPEIEFEINIPDEVIEQINIDELRPLLANHKNLELV